MSLRILIVGMGSIGKRHLRITRQSLPNADIRVLRHQPCTDVPEFSNGCFSSPETACAFAPQVAIIATPAPYHLGIAQQLLQIGCHLLIEKPIASHSEGLADCLKLAHDKGLVIQVGYNLRYLPALAHFRQLVKANIVGTPLSIRCEIGQYLPSWRPGTDYRQGVSARAELGGGALLELSHEIDYLRWIFGEVAWVNAWTGHLSGLDINVEDSAHLILGLYASADAKEAVARLDMDFMRQDTTRCCLVIGEKGSLRWNGLQGSVEHYCPDSATWQTVFSHTQGRDDSYLAQWAEFLDCIEHTRSPSCSGHDGLAVLRIVEAAKQSAALNGARVILDPQILSNT